MNGLMELSKSLSKYISRSMCTNDIYAGNWPMKCGALENGTPSQIYSLKYL